MKKTQKAKSTFLKIIFTTKIPLYFLLLIMLLAGGAVIVITKISKSPQSADEQSDENKSEYNIRRLHGYKFIQPLLSAKPIEESEMYSDIKQAVNDLIQDYKGKGTITSASVYMRDFDKSNWFNVNEYEKYNPGSILKLPVLIAYLKTEEQHPGVLNKILIYNKKYQTDIKQNIVTKSIEFGKAYTVRQLLEYMIIYSDNNANMILNENLNLDDFYKVFSDLNLKVPDKNTTSYPMTARECSRFMEVLFNATYLEAKNSEYAMSLLTQSHFPDGIVKGVPEPNLLIAHKFGESGDNINRQLHETAILYIKDKPYQITIMTQGNKNVELSKLAEVLRDVSKLIYSKLVEK